MHIIGIVVEYNPFHNGHLYQIEQIRNKYPKSAIVVVMSGHFSQRGLPCIVDKYTRAQMALSCGVDLVLELPTVYATSSAERFAEAAINTLHLSGIVDTLCFGSETSDLSLMNELADLLVHEPPFVSTQLKVYLNEGESYPRARLLALQDYLKNFSTQPNYENLDSLLSQPNNILSIEYLKALKRLQSPIKPFSIQRQSSNYHDVNIEGPIASASAIRHQIQKGQLQLAEHSMPQRAFSLLTGSPQKEIHLDDYTELFHYKMIMSNPETLYATWDVPKNLINSLIHATKTFSPLSQIVDHVTSKTYTRATVLRTILRILLEVNEKDMDALKEINWIPYLHVLACRKDSTYLLSKLTTNCRVPLLINVGKDYNKLTPLGKTLFDYETKASKLYALLCHTPNIADKDFTYHPILK